MRPWKHHSFILFAALLLSGCSGAPTEPAGNSAATPAAATPVPSPLTGFESRPLAPLWNRLAALAYAHGEAFYNFRGLRKYKEKFDPEWEPRYLVSPGGLVLPRNLASIALLTSGGLRGLWRK